MRKRIWFILGLGVMMIIAGGVSSLFFYQKLEDDREKNTINKEFNYDNSDELIININNRTSLYLTTSDDDIVHMKKDSYSYNTANKDKTDWVVDKKGNTTTITINNESKIQKFEPAFFNLGDFYDNSINLQIPEKYKKVTVNGSSLDIITDDLILTTLNLQTKHGDINGHNLVVEELKLGNSNGNTYLSETNIEKEFNLTSSNGEVMLSDLSFQKLNAELTNGSIETYSTKGDVAITNQNGDIAVNHAKGNVNLSNKNGDITFQGSTVNYDLDFETIHGSIDMSMPKDAYDKTKVDLSTRFGSISIFNENLDSSTEFSRTTGKTSLKATSKNGDISIDEYYDDDPEYWDE